MNKIHNIKSQLYNKDYAKFNYKFSNNAELIEFANNFGNIACSPFLNKKGLEINGVYDVTPHSNTLLNQDNQAIYSTTFLEFPLHTDGTGKNQPYDIVILYCVKHDDDFGGQTIILRLQDLLKKLDHDLFKLLIAPIYHFPRNIYPIIDIEKSEIRFNKEELIRNNPNNMAVKRFINYIEKNSHLCEKYFLYKDEGIIFLNKKILHGRTAFSENSQRLLKRIRLYCK